MEEIATVAYYIHEMAEGLPINSGDTYIHAVTICTTNSREWASKVLAIAIPA